MPFITALTAAYSLATVYITEFNIDFTWPNVTLSPAEIQAQVADRLTKVRAHVNRADFFTWRWNDGSSTDYFAAKTVAGLLQPWWWPLSGQLPATPQSPANPSPTYMPAGVTTGTSNAGPANQLSAGEINIPAPCKITGVSFYNGGTVNGNVIVGLYNAAGQLVASSGSVAQAGTFGVQHVAFISGSPNVPYYIAAAGRYYVAVINSSATADFALICANGLSCGAGQGSFALPATLPTLNPGAYIIAAGTY